jgi:hypothetical protein
MANYNQANKLSIAYAAYIAGVIDGEGTISLSKRHKNEIPLKFEPDNNTEESTK